MISLATVDLVGVFLQKKKKKKRRKGELLCFLTLACIIRSLCPQACAGPSHCVQGALKYSSFSNRSWVYLKGALEINDT